MAKIPVVEAIVEFDYEAQEPDELTIKKGDIINDIRKKPGGWWEGTVVKSGKRGMFPDNFVKVLEPGNSKMDITLRQGAVVARRCRVVFSYEPIHEDELELQVGQVVEFLAEVEEGWWKGKLNSKIGVFPSNFVTELFDETPETKEASHRKTSRSSVDSDSSKLSNANSSMDLEEPSPAGSDGPELPPKPVKELCRVLFAYNAVNDDELTLHEGDVVTLLSRDGQDKGWWRGELRGVVGVFPDNFVTVITTDETTKPARPPVKSNVVTTNRVKDSITRPAAPQTTAQRKSMELPPKPDEKTSPPGLSKKPVLPPPPLKKPQRSPSGATVNKTLGVTPTEPRPSPTAGGESNNTATGTGTLNTALTLSLKQHSTDAVDGGALSRSSGTFSPTGDVDLDCVGRTAMLTHPTASRVRAPRRRPPSGLPSLQSLDSGLVNGNAEPHVREREERDRDRDDIVNRAPWVEELKMNQAKKNSAQGRTRISVTTPSPAATPVTTAEPVKVTLRQSGGGGGSGGVRPQSMFGTRSFSLSPSPSSPDATSTSAATATAVTLSNKQLNDLYEKVQRLETVVESQQVVLEDSKRAIAELTNKLKEETERRQKMQAEMEKLANFVTQV